MNGGITVSDAWYFQLHCKEGSGDSEHCVSGCVGAGAEGSKVHPSTCPF